MTWTQVWLKSQILQFQTRSLAYFWAVPCIDSTRSKTFCLNLRLDPGLSSSDLGLNFLDLRLYSGLAWGRGTSQSRLETCLSWLWVWLRTCLPSFWSWLFWSGTWLSVFVWRCLLRIISVSLVCLLLLTCFHNPLCTVRWADWLKPFYSLLTHDVSAALTPTNSVTVTNVFIRSEGFCCTPCLGE